MADRQKNNVLDDNKNLLEQDPRYVEIQNELKSKWLREHPGQDFLTGEGQSYLLKINSAIARIFSERYPQDIQSYESLEKERIYNNSANDPTVKQVETDIVAATNADSQVQKANRATGVDSYRNIWDRVNMRETLNRWSKFINEHPKKAEAYKNQHLRIKRVLEFRKRVQNKQLTNNDKGVVPTNDQSNTGKIQGTKTSTDVEVNKEAEKVAIQQPIKSITDDNTKPIENQEITLSANSDKIEPAKIRIKNTFLQGLKTLENNPGKTSAGRLPRQSFEILIGSLTEQSSFQSPIDYKAAYEKLNNLELTPEVLSTYEAIYSNLRLHAHGAQIIRGSGNEGQLSDEAQKSLTNFLPQQVAYATIATSLPKEHLINQDFQQNLSQAILSHDITSDKNLSESFSNIIKTSFEKSNLSLSNNVVSGLSKKVVDSINNLNKSSGLSTGVGLVTAALVVLSSLMDEESTTVSETPSILEEGGIPDENASSLGQSFGQGAGFIIGWLTKKGAKKAVEVGATVATGGTTKAVSWIAKGLGKAVSIFGGLFGGSQDQTQDSLFGFSAKGAMFFLLGLLLIPLFLVIGLPIFIQGVLKPTAMIDNAVISSINGSDSSQPNEPPDDSTPPETPPDQPPEEPVIPGDDSLLPSGFPIASSCVTQSYYGSFSHAKYQLNAVDIGAIALYNAWTIRASHPGTVIVAGSFSGYGQTVLLESLDKRFITYYGHMETGSIKVKVGERVERNQPIGTVDTTGSSTGHHLHYEIRGPRDQSNPWGSRSGRFGTMGTVLNFIPNCRTWSCKWFCK